MAAAYRKAQLRPPTRWADDLVKIAGSPLDVGSTEPVVVVTLVRPMSSCGLLSADMTMIYFMDMTMLAMV